MVTRKLTGHSFVLDDSLALLTMHAAYNRSALGSGHRWGRSYAHIVDVTSDIIIITSPSCTPLKLFFAPPRIVSSTNGPRSDNQQRILVLVTNNDLPLSTFSLPLCSQLGFQLVFQHSPQEASFRVRVVAEDDMGASLSGRQRLVLHSQSAMNKSISAMIHKPAKSFDRDSHGSSPQSSKDQLGRP